MSIDSYRSALVQQISLNVLLIFGLLLVQPDATFAQSGANDQDDGIFRVGPFEHHSVPGGIAIVPTGLSNEAVAPTLRWNSRRLAALYANNQWYALVGIPLSTEAGVQTVVVSAGDKTVEITFAVDEAHYEEQRITISDERKVNPAPLDMERINKESVRLKAVKAIHSSNLLSDHFIWPVTGPISSTFGLQRFFNDQPRRPHGGIDIAMPTGTPIIAPADGVIIDTGNYFFNGNSVFIDHGLGVQTFYAHMDSIAVSNGDTVGQGDVIGTVGETGRVTGAHLHWSLGLNGTWVDPTLVLVDD